MNLRFPRGHWGKLIRYGYPTVCVRLCFKVQACIRTPCSSGDRRRARDPAGLLAMVRVACSEPWLCSPRGTEPLTSAGLGLAELWEEEDSNLCVLLILGFLFGWKQHSHQLLSGFICHLIICMSYCTFRVLWPRGARLHLVLCIDAQVQQKMTLDLLLWF